MLSPHSLTRTYLQAQQSAPPAEARLLLEADVTEVVTAAELRAALQEGHPHVRITADLDLRGDPPATADTWLPWRGYTVNGTQSLVVRHLPPSTPRSSHPASRKLTPCPLQPCMLAGHVMFHLV